MAAVNNTNPTATQFATHIQMDKNMKKIIVIFVTLYVFTRVLRAMLRHGFLKF
jgi:hypothetical protein